MWLRFQPNSALTLWYQKRFAGGGKRMRRIGIVAMARKLLVALWRYVEHGEIPQGAVLSAWALAEVFTQDRTHTGGRSSAIGLPWGHGG